MFVSILQSRPQSCLQSRLTVSGNSCTSNKISAQSNFPQYCNYWIMLILALQSFTTEFCQCIQIWHHCVKNVNKYVDKGLWKVKKKMKTTANVSNRSKQKLTYFSKKGEGSQASLLSGGCCQWNGILDNLRNESLRKSCNGDWIWVNIATTKIEFRTSFSFIMACSLRYSSRALPGGRKVRMMYKAYWNFIQNRILTAKEWKRFRKAAAFFFKPHNYSQNSSYTVAVWYTPLRVLSHLYVMVYMVHTLMPNMIKNKFQLQEIRVIWYCRALAVWVHGNEWLSIPDKSRPNCVQQ